MGTAHAADTVAASVDWTGFYLGASAGAHSFTSVLTNPDASEENYLYGNDSMDATVYGFIGGVGAGYNADFDGFVIEIESDFSVLSGETHSTAYDNYLVNHSSLSYLGTVRGRIGMAFDSLFLYGTGGLAYGQVDTTVCDDECGYNGFSDSEWKFGWIAGLGAEYRVTEAVSIKAEGLYYDFGSSTYDDEVGDDDYKYEVETHGLIARMGLNYSF